MDNDSKTTEIRLTDLRLTLKRCWWLMLAVFVAVSASIYVFTARTHDPKYTSVATLYVRRETDNSVTASDISIATTLIKDFIELNINDSIVEQAREATQTAIPAETLRQMVSLTYTEGTRVMYVTVTADDAVTAQQLANAFADATCAEFNALFDITKEDGTIQSQKMLEVHSYGAKNTTVNNPISLTMPIGIAAGSAILVYLVFLILQLTNGKIQTADDVKKHLNLNVLCEINTAKKKKDQPDKQEDAEFIPLRTSLIFFEKDIKSIAVINCFAKGEATTVAEKLSNSLTKVGKQVRLIPSATPADLTGDCDAYDYAVFDTPPQENALDAAATASLCDGAILVLKKGTLKARKAQSAKELLDKSGCKVLGVILDLTTK